jgi:hypothetical protein
MAEMNANGFKTFPASAAISQFARVKLASDGTIAAAGLAEKEIGTAQVAAFAANDLVAVKLTSAPGTHKMIAKEAIAIGARLYTEAGGKVQDTAEATAFQVGTALTAAGAENDIIEVLYNAHGDTAAS